MANIYHMQGFDISELNPGWVTGLNVGGLDDAGSESFSGTPFWFPYRGGQDEEGRSVYLGRWGGMSQRFYPGLTPSGPRVTGSAWFKFEGTDTGSFTNLFYFRRMTDGGTHLWESYYLRVHRLGGVSVIHNDQVVGNILEPTGEWVCYQFYIDLPAGKIGAIANGVKTEFDIPVDTRSGRWSVRYGGNSRDGGSGTINIGPLFRLDHLIISDVPLNTSGLQGVSVVASADRYEGVNTFKGALVIRGQMYHTYNDIGVVTSLAGYAEGFNLANTMSYIYPQNPATKQPWGDSDYVNVESWGVCHVPFWLNDTNEKSSRLLAMGLSWAIGTHEGPVIKTKPPSRSAYFSGPWVKTNPLKSFTGHVNSLPRPDTLYLEDSEHLTINKQGCLLFAWQEEEETPTSVVGITFAEERRSDYMEWRDILGSPEPFKSFFTTGYNVLGEGNKAFQSNYVTVNYVPVPQGSAYIQGLWDYALTGNTGRWSSTQQIYSNSDVRYSNRMRKLKVRGQGNALQMRVTSEDGKPFSINGWTMSASSNAGV